MTATSSELKRARATELWMIVEKWNWQWPLFKRDFKLWSSKTPRAKPVNEWMNPHFIEVCRVARCWAIEHLLERWKYHRPQSNSNCSNGSRGTSKTLLMVRVISYYHSHPALWKIPTFSRLFFWGASSFLFSWKTLRSLCRLLNLLMFVFGVALRFIFSQTFYIHFIHSADYDDESGRISKGLS